jgi:chromosomal replication initiation ATPase DnaA
LIQQLTFNLPPEPRLTRENFFVSQANAIAMAAIDGWKSWPQQKMLLIGPDGAGKSHLAQIWASDANAVLVHASALTAADLPALAAHGVVGIEDAETLASDPAAEAALFHLHNLLASSGTLLVTAKSPPRDWGLTLPDLASRMQATAHTRLDPPDDALLTAVLAKLFADRQLAILPNLIPYLIARMDRSIAAARSLVAALDDRALAQHRPITRTMAAEILDSTRTE